MRLQVDHLCVSFGGSQILQDISFQVNEGDWLMLVGMNGAGKSTVLRAISGVIPSAGSVLLDGQDVKRMKPSARALKIGMLQAAASSTYAFTVQEIVSMGRYAHGNGPAGRGDPQGKQRIDEALALTGMEPLRHHSLLTLSSGERQRAFLAQVLCQDPALLLLDEPASHLDLSYARQLYQLVDQWRIQTGRAVISVVHDLSVARRFGTHALLLKDGRTQGFGPCREVLTDEALSDAWQMDVFGWMRQLAAMWQDQPSTKI